MIKITNFTEQACAYRNLNRFGVDRHFKIRDEFKQQAQEEKNPEKKVYLFGQAALRDTKGRELWERICTHAETLGNKVTAEFVAEYKTNNYPTEAATKKMGNTVNLSWWKTWLTNFV